MLDSVEITGSKVARKLKPNIAFPFWKMHWFSLYYTHSARAMLKEILANWLHPTGPRCDNFEAVWFKDGELLQQKWFALMGARFGLNIMKSSGRNGTHGQHGGGIARKALNGTACCSD